MTNLIKHRLKQITKLQNSIKTNYLIYSSTKKDDFNNYSFLAAFLGDIYEINDSDKRMFYKKDKKSKSWKNIIWKKKFLKNLGFLFTEKEKVLKVLKLTPDKNTDKKIPRYRSLKINT